jgi:hypothetical protein
VCVILHLHPDRGNSPPYSSLHRPDGQPPGNQGKHFAPETGCYINRWVFLIEYCFDGKRSGVLASRPALTDTLLNCAFAETVQDQDKEKMSNSLIAQLEEKIAEAGMSYYRLVLLVGPQHSAKYGKKAGDKDHKRQFGAFTETA